MSCKCATYDPDSGRWQCSVSGDGCIYLIPNSKRCAIDYGEGPDDDRDPAELLAELEAEYKERELNKDTDDTDDDCLDDDYWDDEG